MNTASRPVTIETERLLLRPFCGEDLELIKRLYCDERVLRYTPFDTLSAEQAEEHLDRIIREWGLPPANNYEWAVLLKATGEKLGRAHIEIDRESDTGMIGWFLAPEYWRRGYASEMTPALIDYAFDVFRLHRVMAVCNPENAASWRTLEKCGMRREAYFRQKCPYVRQGLIHWEDELEYAMLAAERRPEKLR